MGLLDCNDDEDFENTDQVLLRELDKLDEQLHGIRDRIRIQARLRSRAAHLADDPGVQELIAEIDRRHATGDLGPPDAPDLLTERVDRLTRH
jgi:hypothetical protein